MIKPSIKQLLLIVTFSVLSMLIISLIDYGYVSEDEEKFFEASAFGQFTKVQELMPAVGNPNYLSFKGYTPLGSAAFNGHLEIVKFLIANGADVNFRNLDRVGPLYQAAIHGHADVVAYLLDHDATLSEKGNRILLKWLNNSPDQNPVLGVHALVYGN